jgi:pimeloyl-ACP methyl ester carboxylesterase
MGAGAVADAASREPDALRAAILEDPGWRASPFPERRPRTEQVRSLTGWVDELQKLSLDDAIAAGRRSMPTWHEDELPAWAESKLQYRPAPRVDGAPRPDPSRWREKAAAIRVPVLLLCGDPSRALVDVEGAEEAARLCPTLEVVRFDTGHNIRREDFEGFVQAVGAFLARVHR